jgi:TatA/E family protein of Tat protein translocase
MFGTLGGPEVILILVVALIVFGPRRLPEIGKSMGKMLAEFRKASNDFKRTIEDELEAEKVKEAQPAPLSAPEPTSVADVTVAEASAGDHAATGADASPPVAPDAPVAPPAPAAGALETSGGPPPAEPSLEPPAGAVVSRNRSADES